MKNESNEAAKSQKRFAIWAHTTGWHLLAAARSAANAIGSRTAQVAGRFARTSSIVLTYIGVWIALIAFMVDLEDRKSERTFRAWQVVQGFESRDVKPDTRAGASGSSLREALEFLNREFDGFVCGSKVRYLSELLTGNDRRECLFPKKKQRVFGGTYGARCRP